jgi:signal transduction histidine kinase
MRSAARLGITKSAVSWAYIGVVVAAAIGLTLFWSRTWTAPAFRSAGLAALLVVLASIAQHFPLPVGPQRKIDASISVYFASLLVFGAIEAIAVVGVAQALGQATLALRRNPQTGRRRRGIPEIVFNTAQLTVATGVASVAYFAVVPEQAPAPLERIANIWALPIAAATMYLANSLAVATIVGIHQSRNPIDVWRAGRLTYTLEFIGLLLCGVVTAIAAIEVWWAPLSMAALTAILFASLWRTTEALNREQELRRQAQATTESIRSLQEAIERERATLAAVMEGMTDGLLVLNADGRVRYCNPQVATLLNLDAAAIADQSALELIRRAAPWLAEPVAATSEWERMIRDPQRHWTSLLTIVGAPTRYVMLSVFPISPESEARCGILLRDVTDTRQLALLEERDRIAMDLHDGVIQRLYGIGLSLAAYSRSSDRAPLPAVDALRHAVVQIDDVIGEIRNTIFALQSDDGKRSLRAELSTVLATSWIDGLHPRLEIDPDVDQKLSANTRSTIAQIAREAIANLNRHAEASEATIRLKRVGDYGVFSISDNGKGFNPAEPGSQTGQGLQNMIERARMLGGRLDITSAPGEGTDIRIEFPLPSEEES